MPKAFLDELERSVAIRLSYLVRAGNRSPVNTGCLPQSFNHELVLI